MDKASSYTYSKSLNKYIYSLEIYLMMDFDEINLLDRNKVKLLG